MEKTIISIDHVLLIHTLGETTKASLNAYDIQDMQLITTEQN